MTRPRKVDLEIEDLADFYANQGKELNEGELAVEEYIHKIEQKNKKLKKENKKLRIYANSDGNNTSPGRTSIS